MSDLTNKLDIIASELEPNNPLLALAIDRISDRMASVDSTIEFVTKSHYGGEPLTYVVSKQKDAINKLTGTKTLTKRHIEALKELGFMFKESKSETVL